MSEIQAQVQLNVGDFRLDIAFEAPGQGVTALFGRSGSGKTSALRWIAGLVPSRSGFLSVNGQTWEDTSNRVFLPAHKRSVGYVFQEAGLFPHLSIEANLRYGLKRIPTGNDSSNFDQTVDLLGIGRFLKRSPFELSGGERQRVAIARSLLIKPQLLLFDEPMAALDATSKREILPYIERIKAELNIPMIYVSHSLNEVRRLSDHVIVVENGVITDTGPISKLSSKIGDLDAPATVAPPAVSFIGNSGSGKTTLIESLIPLLKAKGYRVGAIKHDAHQFEIDHQGKDSYRFTHAGADAMVIASTTKLAMVKTASAPQRIEDIIQDYFTDFDIVLTEGYRSGALPKIRVLRSGHSEANRRPDAEIQGEVLAIASDLPPEDGKLPPLSLNNPEQIALFIEQHIIKQQS